MRSLALSGRTAAPAPILGTGGSALGQGVEPFWWVLSQAGRQPWLSRIGPQQPRAAPATGQLRAVSRRATMNSLHRKREINNRHRSDGGYWLCPHLKRRPGSRCQPLRFGEERRRSSALRGLITTLGRAVTVVAPCAIWLIQCVDASIASSSRRPPASGGHAAVVGELCAPAGLQSSRRPGQRIVNRGTYATGDVRSLLDPGR